MFADTASHQAVLSSRLRRWLYGWVRLSDPRPINISILNGLQAACHRISRLSELTIGSDSASDLILLDETVPDQAVTLVFENSLFGNLVSVRNLGADVSVNGTTVSVEQAAENLTLPLTLTVCGVDLDIGSQRNLSKSPQSLIDRSVQRIIISALAILLVVALMVVTESQQNVAQIRLSGSDDSPDLEVTQEAFAMQLRDRLETSGLGLHISVGMMQEGGLKATGDLPEALKPVWDREQAWFEGLPDAPHLISSVSITSAQMDLPPITMVRLSEPPALYLATGQILEANDSLSDGWRLSEVLENKVIFVRGIETVEFRLGDN